MGETKVIRVRKSTIVCSILIILLIAGCIALYYFGFVQKGKQIEKVEAESKELKAKNVELEEKIETIEKEVEEKENSTPKKDKIDNAIEEYIVSDFGPKNNIKNAGVIAKEELSVEDFYKQTPGGPISDEEIEEAKNNKDLTHGYCLYYIELKNIEELSMEGSSPEIQKIVGNIMVTEAVYTYNNTTGEVEFATSYGFGN